MSKISLGAFALAGVVIVSACSGPGPGASEDPSATPTARATPAATPTQPASASPIPSATRSAVQGPPIATFALGPGDGCDSLGVADPVFGALAGAVDDPEVAWLLERDGRRLAIAWPAGFTAWFDPDVELRDGDGRTVGRKDDVFLFQVPGASAAGTPTDSYVASGQMIVVEPGDYADADAIIALEGSFIHNGCYPAAP